MLNEVDGNEDEERARRQRCGNEDVARVEQSSTRKVSSHLLLICGRNVGGQW